MPPPPPISGATVTPPKQLPKEVEKATEESSPLEIDPIIATLTSSLQVTNLDDRRKQDINKRLKVMEEKWRKGDLAEPVRKGLDQMSKMLEKNEVGEAEKIQMTLAMDYTSQCGSWIIGIKHLIAAAKQKDDHGEEKCQDQ